MDFKKVIMLVSTRLTAALLLFIVCLGIFSLLVHEGSAPFVTFSFNIF